MIVRIIFINEQGLSNDELSAWYRTRFTDWTTFWHEGVKSGDMHPAFYQVLLWIWVRIFGDSEWALRSTSLIFYILNSILLYRIASRHFSQLSGLLVQALYVGLTFTIMNTVFARPYNSGVFFLLLAFWSILEIKNDPNKIRWTFIFTISLLGGMLSHYFAFYTAAVMGISALFFVGKSKLKYIVTGGVIAMICFIPHLPITLFQIGRGGLGWLAPPGKYWILEFTYLFFNESWVLAGIIILLILSTLIIAGKLKSDAKIKFSFMLFFSAFIGAFIISHLFTPILRELVMLFLLPFLLLPLFYQIQFKTFKSGIILIAVLTFLPLVDSTLRHQVYKPNHFGVFKEIGEAVNEANEQYGFQNITFASNYNNVEYINYYVEENLNESIVDWEGKEIPGLLYSRAKDSKTPYFCYSVNNKYDTPMFLEVIRSIYPGLEKVELTKQSAFYLFNKNAHRKLPKPLISEYHTKSLITQDEFTNGIEINVGKLQKYASDDTYFLLKCKGRLIDSIPFYFVSSIERNGQILMNGKYPAAYFAYDQSQINSIGVEEEFFLAFNLPSGLEDTDLLKSYFWNPEKGKVQTSNIKLYVINKNN